MSLTKISVDIYLKEKEIFVFPVSRTISGYSYTEVPAYKLSIPCKASELGHLVIKATKKVRKDLDDSFGKDENFLKDLSEKSWNSLIKNVSYYCSLVKINNNPMKIKPAFRSGNGFEFDSATPIADEENLEDIGQKILEAFDKYNIH